MFRFSEQQRFGGEGAYVANPSITGEFTDFLESHAGEIDYTPELITAAGSFSDFLETHAGTATHIPLITAAGSFADFLESHEGTATNEGLYIGVAPRFSEQQRFGGRIGEESVLTAGITDFLESFSGTAEYVAPPLPVNPTHIYWTAPLLDVEGAPITDPLSYELGVGDPATFVTVLDDEAYGDVERRAPLDINWFTAGEVTASVRARNTTTNEVSVWSEPTTFEAIISRASSEVADFLEPFGGTATFTGVPEYTVTGEFSDFLEAVSGEAALSQPPSFLTGGFEDFLETFSGDIARPPGRTLDGSHEDALEAFSGAAVVRYSYLAGWCKDAPLVDAPIVRYGSLVDRPTVLDCDFTVRTNLDQAA